MTLRPITNRSAVLLSVAAFCLSSCCRADDTVILRNGTEIDGTVVEENSNTVVVKTRGGVKRSYRRGDVDTIIYERRTTTPRIELGVPETKVEEKPKVDEKQAKAEGGKKADGDKDEKGQKSAEKKGDEAKEEWTPPKGLAGFPDKAERMEPDKEQLFIKALEELASETKETRDAARSKISALGEKALPYVVAGTQHASVYARTACMEMIPGMGGKTAIKQVIEVFYSAMPDKGAAATYQVPFIRAVKDTVGSLTGQAFISVEPRSAFVQDGLKQYIDWYNQNIDTHVPQLGEPKLDKTDPEYQKKLKEARALKLVKRSWPQPSMPEDQIAGPNKTGAPKSNVAPIERPSDKAYRDQVPTVGRNDPLNRDRNR